eukprot:1392061-Amorphochlora_amoeboformis.AAC.2
MQRGGDAKRQRCKEAEMHLQLRKAIGLIEFPSLTIHARHVSWHMHDTCTTRVLAHARHMHDTCLGTCTARVLAHVSWHMHDTFLSKGCFDKACA